VKGKERRFETPGYRVLFGWGDHGLKGMGERGGGWNCTSAGGDGAFKIKQGRKKGKIK